ncbi:MAG: hypothetical protein JNL11_16130 [Bdellovibrionaceae bacterium]|nr:hypothetical protein [Pseudobdellovibrionaceae bacterium]
MNFPFLVLRQLKTTWDILGPQLSLNEIGLMVQVNDSKIRLKTIMLRVFKYRLSECFLALTTGLVLWMVILLGCSDGPNATSSSKEAARGVHHADGFQLTVKINNGGSVTPESLVAVKISAVNAEEMYITQESSCNVGGEWEPFRAFKQWVLQKDNAVNFFYVKVRNSGRESDCAYASITHDTVAPTIQLFSPLNGATLMDPDELSLQGTCTEDGKIAITVNSLVSYSSPCLGGVWTYVVDISELSGGSMVVEIKGIDPVLNSSAGQSFTFIK